MATRMARAASARLKASRLWPRSRSAIAEFHSVELSMRRSPLSPGDCQLLLVKSESRARVAQGIVCVAQTAKGNTLATRIADFAGNGQLSFS